MYWYHYIAVVFAGAFAANGVPHFVQGICGNWFQTPFSSPPARGESSPLVNVVWGMFNFAVAGLLIQASFPPTFPPPLAWCAVFVLGGITTSVVLSWYFSRIRNAPPHP